MKKVIESFDQAEMKSDWRTQYRRYRTGRLKHQYWLWNRKSKDQALVDEYDYRILKNCQPGHTIFFSSAGYYLKDIFPEITVVEQFPVVKTFYPDVVICTKRQDLVNCIAKKADNFAVVNNRAEMWTDVQGLSTHLRHYTQIMNDGCRVFYSFRDTQMYVNRLKVSMQDHFLSWALSLKHSHDLSLVWHQIDFRKKIPDQSGNFDFHENSDTANGNLKFWWVYKGCPWAIS
jgi:hypothetical protein